MQRVQQFRSHLLPHLSQEHTRSPCVAFSARMASSCSNSPQKTRRRGILAARRDQGLLARAHHVARIACLLDVVGRRRDRHEEPPATRARRGRPLSPGAAPGSRADQQRDGAVVPFQPVVASRHALSLLRAASPGHGEVSGQLPQVLIDVNLRSRAGRPAQIEAVHLLGRHQRCEQEGAHRCYQLLQLPWIIAVLVLFLWAACGCKCSNQPRLSRPRQKPVCHPCRHLPGRT